jgi:hypothetical protein
MIEQKYFDKDLTMSRISWMFRISSVLVFTAMVGCGSDGPELARVQGKVTLDGKPVQGAVVTYVPVGGTASYGKTNSKGEYQLMFTDSKYGAMIGSHSVELEVKRIPASELKEMKAEGQEVPTEFVDIPKKYRKAGALTAEVKRGSNEINFDMTSKD